MNRQIFLISIFIFISAISNYAFSQCNSKIKAETKTLTETKGEIVVEVTTSENFVCKINAISGRGAEVINTQNGRGNKNLKFSNLDITKNYQIDVEFTTEQKQLCKRLQKNNLIFEPK